MGSLPLWGLSLCMPWLLSFVFGSMSVAKSPLVGASDPGGCIVLPPGVWRPSCLLYCLVLQKLPFSGPAGHPEWLAPTFGSELIHGRPAFLGCRLPFRATAQSGSVLFFIFEFSLQLERKLWGSIPSGLFSVQGGSSVEGGRQQGLLSDTPRG